MMKLYNMKKCILCEKKLDKRNKKYFCKCGKSKDVRSKQCKNCFDNRLTKKYYCKCGREITKVNKYCQSCYIKTLKGSRNPNFNNKWTKNQKNKQSKITKLAMNKPKIINKMKKNHANVCGKNNPMFGIHRFGEDAPCWIDGRSYENYPQEWTGKLRESIRNRDNYECQNCGMTEEEHLTVYGRVLEVHHIDYNKQNCNKENLITTCKQCNIRANANRDYWQKIYIRKILCLKNV